MDVNAGSESQTNLFYLLSNIMASVDFTYPKQ